jgi:hypothetical protein
MSGAGGDPALNRFILLVLSLLAVTANADERILSYQSEIAIETSGRMEVVETIRVRAEADQILRGIYREFPTDYRDRLGNRYRVRFDVLAVSRDSGPEPFFTDRRSNGVRVYVGDADVFLSPDEYEYQIRYATDFQLGFFETHDELYWNITGNGWLFPIDAVSARITLPAPADGGVLSIEGYTGAPGSTEQAVSTEIESERSARVTSSRPLAPGEGLTLVFSFPKGIVAEPTERERSQRLLADNTGLLLGLLGFIAVSVYFFFVWLRVGRDPAAGVIFPQYQAPPGLSPAAARYVRRMGYDSKTFTAAVISLAVKGQLELDDRDDNYTVRLANRSGRQATQAPGSALSAGERAILKRLFADDAAVTLDKSNTVLLLKAQAAHRNALKLENYRVYFANNTIFVLPPILIVIFTCFAMAGFPPPNPIGIGLLFVSLIEVPIFGWLLKAPTQLGRNLLDKMVGLKLYLSVAV